MENILKTIDLLVAGRCFVSALFGVGAMLLIYEGIDGWGWCIFASIMIGCVSYEPRNNNIDDNKL